MKTFIQILSLLIIFSCSNKNSAQKNTETTATEEPSVETPAKEEIKPVEKVEETAVVSEEIKWLSYDEAVKLTKKKPKKIFIDVYTDWCGWCKKMDKTTFKDPKISEYMNKQYYAVKLNAESNKTITYKSQEMTEKQLSSTIFKITGYPSTVYLESNQTIIQPIPGYMDVATLDKILHYIGEDYYKTQTWEQFQMSYGE